MSKNVSVCTLPLAGSCELGDFNMSCCYGGASGASFIESYGEDGTPRDAFESIRLFGASGDAIWKSYMLECPNHIKLDVDGTEHLILHGMEGILADKKLRSVLVECCDLFERQKNSVDDILRNFGFRLAKVGKSPLYAEGLDSHVHNYIYARN